MSKKADKQAVETVKLPALNAENQKPFSVAELNLLNSLLLPFMAAHGEVEPTLANIKAYLLRMKEDSSTLDKRVAELVDETLTEAGKDGRKMANILPWVASSMGTPIDGMAEAQDYVRSFIERNSSESHALEALYFRVVKGRNAGVWLWTYKPEEEEELDRLA
ncbi:MAG: hypothetical protein LC122_13635 [Chitinophagales bacterium]|nr:hypothetical protein [Chitinophagales bacterium]